MCWLQCVSSLECLRCEYLRPLPKASPRPLKYSLWSAYTVGSNTQSSRCRVFNSSNTLWSRYMYTPTRYLWIYLFIFGKVYIPFSEFCLSTRLSIFICSIYIVIFMVCTVAFSSSNGLHTGFTHRCKTVIKTHKDDGYMPTWVTLTYIETDERNCTIVFVD